jgi:hypothetical protein
VVDRRGSEYTGGNVQPGDRLASRALPERIQIVFPFVPVCESWCSAVAAGRPGPTVGKLVTRLKVRCEKGFATT